MELHVHNSSSKTTNPIGQIAHEASLSIDLHALPVRKLTQVCSSYMWLQANALR